MSKQQQNFKPISFQVSAEQVTKYLDYAIHQILYQRQLFPPKEFKTSSEFPDPPLPLMRCKQPFIAEYLKRVITDVDLFINLQDLQSLKLFIYDESADVAVERWEFRITYEKQNTVTTKDETTLEAEIREEIRRFASSVASSDNLLPRLHPETYRFVMAASKFTNIAGMTPTSHPKLKANKVEERIEELLLWTFSTSLHQVDIFVAYKKIADEPRNDKS